MMNMYADLSLTLMIGSFLALVGIIAVNTLAHAKAKAMLQQQGQLKWPERYKRAKILNDIWLFSSEYVSVIGRNTITDSLAAACRHILHLLSASNTPDECATSVLKAGLSFAKVDPTDDSHVVVAAQKTAIAVNNYLRLQLPEDHREKLDQFLSNDASSQAMRENMRELVEDVKKRGYPNTRFIL